MENQKMEHCLLIVQDPLKNKSLHHMLFSPLTFRHENIPNYTIRSSQLSRMDLNNSTIFKRILNLIKQNLP